MFQLQLNSETAVEWTKRCRDIVAHYFERIDTQRMIGGPECTVEYDETLVAKRKSHEGRLVPAQWLFGGIVRGTGNAPIQCFLELVPDRKRATLHEVLSRRVHQGTTIYTDCWAAYGDLSNVGFIHEKVNHSKNFVKPENHEVHTQSVESLWSRVKRHFRRSGYTRRIYLDDYTR